MWNRTRTIGVAIGVSGLVLVGPGANAVRAHCDGIDGPVVLAAQRALGTGNVNLALIWIQPEDEAEIRSAFAETLAVRRLGPRALSLADRAFFETLVRLHRTGEGAPYEGLKPAGRDLGPAIPAVDRAVERVELTELDRLLSRAVSDGLKERFEKVLAARTYKPDDVAAGRAYVAAYVEFVHYAERLHAAATGDAPGHFEQR
jgi:hypothetical protein